MANDDDEPVSGGLGELIHGSNDDEKSYREKVNDELDEGQIDDDSDKSVREQVSDIRQGNEQENSGSQASQGSVSPTNDGGAGLSIVAVLGRILVLVIGLLLIADALNIVNILT